MTFDPNQIAGETLPNGGRADRRSLFVVCYMAVFAMGALHAPQPLLGVIRDEFGVTKLTASLVTTLALLPLGFAPVAYGFVLESFSAKRLMAAAAALIALTELAVYRCGSFHFLLGLRLVQGLLVSALLTSLMTYISGTAEGRAMQKAMATYIAATIFGGFAGRLLSGFISTHCGWRSSFLFLFLEALAGLAALSLLPVDSRASFQKLRLRGVADLLRSPGFLRIYILIGCCFFVFTSLLNFLPFRMEEIGDRPSEFRIALMYSGYLVGIVISLSAMGFVRALGGEARAISTGLAVFLASAFLFTTDSTALAFGAMFLFCAGFFLVHSVAPGLLNRRASEGKGVVNGLYISFYYGGGTLGSYFPGMIYQGYGWTSYVLFLAGTLLFAFLLSLGVRREA